MDNVLYFAVHTCKYLIEFDISNFLVPAKLRGLKKLFFSAAIPYLHGPKPHCMKKTLSFFLFASYLLSLSSRAQAQWTTSGSVMYNTNTGFVDIGLTNPTANLSVLANTHPSFTLGVSGNQTNGVAQINTSLHVVSSNATATAVNGAVAWDYYNYGNSPSWSGTLIEHVGSAVTGNTYGMPAANQGHLIFQNVANGVIGSNGANIYISPATVVSTTFLTNGNVLIGKTTQTNAGYKLDVNGNTRSNKVVVNTTGADFVFDSAYHLRALPEVDTYISQNHHLPDIQPAEEMKKEGLDVGDNQTRLLQKVEELTLYLIKQDKQLQQQAQLLQAQQEKINHLEKIVKKAKE
jgi:hypothetical protein